MAQGGAAPLDTGVTDNGSPGAGGNITPPAGQPAAPRGGKDGVNGARARAVAAIEANPATAAATNDPAAPANAAGAPTDPGTAAPTPAKKETEIPGDPDLVARMARLSAENRELRKRAEAATPDLTARADRMGKIETLIKEGKRLDALKLLEVSYQDITRDHLAQDPDTDARAATDKEEARLDELGKKIDALAEDRKAEKDAEAKANADASRARIRTGLHEIVTKDAGRFHYIAKPSQFDRALEAAITHAKTKGGAMRETLGRGLTDDEAQTLVLEGFDNEEKKLRADFGDPAPGAARPAAGIDAGVSAGIQRQEAEIKHTDARTAKKRAADAILRASGN